MTYYHRLDAFRAFAVASVVYTHYFPEKYWLFGIYWGEYGVRFFFVLSGFLITRSLLKDLEQANNKDFQSVKNFISRFYIRRFYRLAPVLIATLTLAAILDFPETRDSFFWHITYLSNIYFAINDSWGGVQGPLWSLSVEEQYYLFWPFLILFFSRKTIIYLIILSIPMVWAYRIIFKQYVSSEIAMWVLLPNSMDALFIGGFIAILYKQNSLIHFDILFKALAFTSIVYVLSPAFEGYAYPKFISIPEVEVTVLCITFAWIIVAVCDQKFDYFDFLLLNPFVVHIGKISYGIYLFHTFVYYGTSVIMRNIMHFNDSLIIIIAATIITISLAMVSWKYFESPIINWRNGRFPPLMHLRFNRYFLDLLKLTVVK